MVSTVGLAHRKLIRAAQVLGIMKPLHQAKAKHQAQPSQNDSGLTLLEALVAMIIITVVVTVITPPVFLAVGTRVNNRRTEQALQVAQAEIERVRLLMMGSETFADLETSGRLPPEAPDTISPKNLQEMGAPTQFCAGEAPGEATCVSATSVYQSAASNGLYVQTFRDAGWPEEGETIAFNMGVRVYSSEAFDASQNPVAALQTEPASVGFTSGTKQRSTRPLVVMYTEMSRGSQTGGLTEMNNYINQKYN